VFTQLIGRDKVVGLTSDWNMTWQRLPPNPAVRPFASSRNVRKWRSSRGALDKRCTLRSSFCAKNATSDSLSTPSGFGLANAECAASQAHGRPMLLCGDRLIACH